MAAEVQIDSSNILADDFYNLFNISKPIENDTRRPHPKFLKSNENTIKRLQDRRRNELLENIKRFFYHYYLCC